MGVTAVCLSHCPQLFETCCLSAVFAAAPFFLIVGPQDGFLYQNPMQILQDLQHFLFKTNSIVGASFDEGYPVE